MMGANKDKTTTKKDSVRITLYTKKLINKIVMFYLKAKIYSSEVLSHQEKNRNMTEEKRDQYGNDKIED